MKKILSLALLFWVPSLFAQSFLTVTYDDSYLIASKKALQNKDPQRTKALEKLIQEADEALQMKALSVTEKSKVPPSGDKRDYMTLAPYWFPDSSKADGLPYIRRDGVRNPEVNDYPERENIKKMADAVLNLSLAYYFTEKPVYANKAAEMIKVWFLHPEYGMNPNFNYGQAIKGVNEGRGAGLIEARMFSMIMNSALLIQNTPSWNAQDQKALQKWFSDFLEWMDTSKVGKQELKAVNNHGTYFELLRLSICLYTGQLDRGRDYIEHSAKKRIFAQQTEDGQMPLELARTLAMHYTTFNMEALFALAIGAEKIGIDLFNYVDEEGKSLRKYVDFILPYYCGEKAFTWQQIKPFAFERAETLLRIAGNKMHEERYTQAAEKIGKKTPQYLDLLIGQQPINR